MTLNHFEQSLLTDLRAEVGRRGAAAAVPSATGRTFRRWGWSVPAGVAMAVAAASGLSQPSPAFAVHESGDRVEVTIDRLTDAQGLEQTLAGHGVRADVSYAVRSSGSDGDVQTFPAPAGGGPGTRTAAFPVSVEGDEFTVVFDKDSIPDGQVLVISSSNGDVSGLTVQLTPGRPAPR